MAENKKQVKYDIVFDIGDRLENNITAYEKIGGIISELSKSEKKCVLLDFSKVEFISANLFATLGACIEVWVLRQKHKVYGQGINDKISHLMAKNRFGRLVGMASEPDEDKSCVRYDIFAAETECLEQFEKYILLEIFEHKEIPMMEENYKNGIIDNFLEIFNNVIDHSQATTAHVCGQFFYESKMLVFSIADIGLTFQEKIEDYFKHIGKEAPAKKIEWALEMGNSTKIGEPGGIGLNLLLRFLKDNKGFFCVVSGNEYYEYGHNGEKTNYLTSGYPGTVVTIGINLADSNMYFLFDNSDVTIDF